MKAFVAIFAVFAAAAAAPADYAAAPAAAVLADPALAYAAAPVAAYAAAPVAAHVPAPYTTSAVQGAPLETVHQPAPIISKQLHFGQTEFVSGHAVRINKPPTPFLPIQVPTALKSTVRTNPAIVKSVKEPFVVNEPYTVEKHVQVPYDVPVVREQLVEVPVPVHVDQPYAVHHPVPVEGEPIVNVRRGPAQVYRTHEQRVHQPHVQVHTEHIAQPVVSTAVVAAPAAYAAGTYGYGLNAYGLNNAYGYSGLVNAAAPVAAVAAEY